MIIICSSYFFFFFKLRFTPSNVAQPLQGMELREKEAQKDENIQGISLERTYSQEVPDTSLGFEPL